ncbi:hypothetical protein KGY73_00155 [bacterium]|nr:hypothetical protein [bacterium]
MDRLSKDGLTQLMKKQQGLCVSIYMPTERAGRETRQNPIRFKNMMGETEKQLKKGGVKFQEIQNYLQPLQRLQDDNYFWLNQSDGLALFLSSQTYSYYRLPFRFNELVVVNYRFHIKPLLPLLSEEKFYILALSQNDIKLFQGTRFTINEIELEGVPKNISEALGYDNLQKQLLFHPEASVGKDKQWNKFHGHGGGPEKEKDFILQFFRKVNEGVYERLKEETVPLVLAGVDYLLPLYREVNTYSNLLEEGIEKNTQNMKESELHAQAWKVVEPAFLKAQKEALEEYHQLVGTGHTSQHIEDIVPASYYGRVGILFVSRGAQIWGKYNPDKNEVIKEESSTPQNEDLLDFAALHTLLRGGRVYVVEPDKVPQGGSTAAIYRF